MKKNLQNKILINKVINHLIVFLFIFPVIIMSFVLSPEQIESGQGITKIFPKCAFKSLTGYSCPTCGMTRAFCAISRCEFRKACDYNFFSCPLYLCFVLGALWWLFSFTRVIFSVLKNKQDCS